MWSLKVACYSDVWSLKQKVVGIVDYHRSASNVVFPFLCQNVKRISAYLLFSLQSAFYKQNEG